MVVLLAPDPSESLEPPAADDRRPTVERRIELAPYDLAAALTLERELGVSHTLGQILVRRGIRDAASARELLGCTVRHDPLAFEGIEAVLDTIRRHIRDARRIVVHGDYDVDGVCATAVLVRALRTLGADVGWFIPSRHEDGYGLSARTVDRLVARGVGLLVTVDCGITAVQEVARARAAGLEVVVTDHHHARADGALPDCPILHPTIGRYPFTELCGTAVAHKLALALGAPDAEDDLELVALATVADLVPLRDENRRLVREGLRRLARTRRPGLRALLEVSRSDPSALDAGCLGFRLAPRINAAGRMRSADAALELLLTDDVARAEEIARELDALNAERRAIEQRMTWEAERLADEMGERSAYVLAAEGWHPGVVGIVASRIVERHHRPAILVALDRDGKAPGQGSGRSIPGFDLLGALHAAAPHLLTYGGHTAAAGLTVAPDSLQALRDAVEAHAAERLTPELLTPLERVDAVVSGADLNLELAEELLALEPCGMGHPGPNLLLTGARFDGVRPMGEGRHARFTVVSGGARASAVAFGCDGRVPGADGEPLQASFRLERNVFRGAIEPRLVLRHARPCGPGEPIRLLGEEKAPSAPGGGYLSAVLAELDRPLPDAGHETRAGDGRVAGGPSDGELRTVLDRRGGGPLAVLADALSAAAHEGSSVLAICGDTDRRLPGLASRTGGFTLAAYADLELEPSRALAFAHLVALDPPVSPAADAALQGGRGFTHLAWGDAELRFSQQMHEWEFALRAQLVTLYRGLKSRGRAAGEELEHLLRGDGSHPRPPRLAGRLVRVLAELELVSLDRALPALTLTGAQPTQLERSRAYRAYAQLYEDGLSFLDRAHQRQRT